MNSSSKVALGGLAFVAVAAIAALSLINSDARDSAGAADSSATSGTALPALGDSLPAGKYYVDAHPHSYDDEGTVEDGSTVYRVTFDLPEGWTGIGWAVTKTGSDSTAIAFEAPHIVHNTPCDAASGGRSTLADLPEMRTPAGFTAKLAELWQGGTNPLTHVPTDPVTFRGRGVSYVELTAPTSDFAECSGGRFMLWTGRLGGSRWLQEPGQLNRVWVITIQPGLLLVDAALEPGASSADQAEVDAIVDSIDIVVLPLDAP